MKLGPSRDRPVPGLRVLHVIKGLGPGGAERLLVSLAQEWEGRVGVDVAFLRPDKAHLVPELEAAGASTHLLSGPRGLADPRWPGRLRRLVRRLGADVVHLHSPAVAGVARVALRASRPRPALISTEHNDWRSFTRPTRIVNALTGRLDDVRLAVSDEVRTSMWRPLRKRTVVLLHGVPVARIAARSGERAAARLELGVADDQVVVAIVANFRDKKDYPSALAAAAVACARDDSLRFVAVGQGPLESQLRDLHDRSGLGDRWRFLGYRADAVRVLVAADVFTLTSVHEGLPISLLEAAALSLPAVVSGVG
ncbi:MAG TPA: glycosyltransferase, partial [Acidimicrobiales bacterium]